MSRFSKLSLLILTFILSGCNSKVSEKPLPENKSVTKQSPLQQAAIEAQAPKVKPDYLKADPGPGKLTPELIHSNPSINGPSLRRAKISPDGTFVTVLQGRAEDAGQQDLWAYDLETGEGRLLVSSTDLLGAPEELSAEEKNRRERAREYGKGIVSYDWAGDNLLLFPLGGDIYLYDLKKNESRQVTATKGFETDAKVSKDGRYVGYVRENNLFITDLNTGLERQLSDGATDLIRNATASFVVQEELDRHTGFWMSADTSMIAYTQIDESPVAIENRIEFGADGVKNISQRYPFAGTKNATVELGVVNRRGGKTRWIDLGDDKDIYLTRVAWSKDSKTLFVGVLSRDHTSHKILTVNPATGTSNVFFEETSPTWLNIRSQFLPTEDGAVLWISERDGKRALFSLREGSEPVRLTPENMLVNSLSCTTDNAETIYVSGWQDNALERHIFKITNTVDKPDENSMIDEETSENSESSELAEATPLAEPNVIQISKGEGRHSASFNKNCERYIGNFSNPDTPFQTRAFTNDGTPLAWLNENPLSAEHPYAPYLNAHIKPEFGTIAAADGTPMDYMLYKPLDLKPGEKRPTVTIVYGGPGVQRVHKGWERRHFERMLAHHGFVVFTMDNRGATNRGKAFEDVLHRAMGRSEVVDQSTGATWLKKQPYVDETKMGVYGWSYGGYMALHMLAQTDQYQAGVSGAPVTDWALYDTAYTERYLGDPNTDTPNYTAGAYENGSVFPYLDGLTEPFLLIHGMADDNVVFRHSIKLMDEMQKRGAHNMRIMTYPGEKHGFRGTENKIHRDRQILEFFLEELGND